MTTLIKNDEEFREVTGKRKIRKKLCYKFNDKNKNENELVDIDLFTKRLTKINEEMESSEFLKKTIKLIESALITINQNKIEKLICLGLGSFTTNIDCLHQLSLFTRLGKTLHVNDFEYYDPVFSEEEQRFLEKNDIKVSSHNNEGCYTIESNTLICLPHCPTELTNNILWQNWNSDSLSKIILLSNSFDDLLMKHSKEELLSKYKYINQISTFTTELPLENKYHFNDIFNNISIHVFKFPLNVINNDEFWKTDAKQKNYSIEMITGELKKLNFNIL